MTGAPRPDVTLLLERARAGDALARGDLIAQVYDEMCRVAADLMRREHPGHALSPTAVVHEAVIRLLGEAAFDRAGDRSYLFAAAARAMREVLIDHARRRATARRGGGRRRVPLDAVVDYCGLWQAGGMLLNRYNRAGLFALVPQFGLRFEPQLQPSGPSRSDKHHGVDSDQSDVHLPADSE